MKTITIYDFFNNYGVLVATFTEKHYSYAMSFAEQHPALKCVVTTF